jgi:hypothetical protein
MPCLLIPSKATEFRFGIKMTDFITMRLTGAVHTEPPPHQIPRRLDPVIRSLGHRT